MKAIVQTGAKSISVTDRERPSYDSDQALVAVHSSGVCGSDAHAYLYEGGYEWVSIPRIMGHEYAGTVVEVGDAVETVEPGDRIVENPTRNCGTCFQCKNGQSNVCQRFSLKGMHRDGAYAEYTVADAANLHVVPEDVPLEHAAITEPLSVATRAVFERSSITPGDTVLVEGPGPIGVLLANVVDSIGAQVVVSGLGRDTDYRLPLLEGMGIETINLDDRSLDETTDELTDGVGFDVIVDSTGHPSGVEQAVDLIRKGGEILIVGLPGSPSDVPVSTLVRGEVTVETSYGSMWRDFDRALAMLAEGVVDAESIVDSSFSPSDPEEAFETFLESGTCKPVFSFESAF